MNKISIGRIISIGGIFTSLTVIFQAAPVFFPVIGLFLSPLSTLPIAIAAVYHISLGLMVYFTSALILLLVNVQEMVILLFTTGLLGVVTGSLLYRKGMVISIAFSGLLLTLGIIIITYFLGIPAFGDFTNSISTPLVFLLFSLIYASIWNFFIGKLINYFMKTNLLQLPDSK